MKKLACFLSILFVVTTFVPVVQANDGKVPSELSKKDEQRLKELNERVLEIKSMDFAEMTKGERKEVRQELRDINKEAKAVGGGVYISAGAIIIILLLLLIIT